MKKNLPLYIIAGFTLFGYHCGAGFASGRQVWIYANQFGKIGLIVPFIAWICCSAILYIIAEYSRLKKATSYKDIVSIYYDHPVVNRIALFLWDILILMFTLTASGNCIAGCGTLLNNLWRLPYFVGCAAFVILMIVIVCFGKGILERLGKLGTLLILIFFSICLITICPNLDTIGNVMTTSAGAGVTKPSVSILIWKGISYGIIQSSFFQSLAVMAGRFENRKQSMIFTVVGFVLNCGAMVAAFFAVMVYYPQIGESIMPIFTIVSKLSGTLGTVMMVGYNLVLILAYITTAGTLIAGGQARYTPVLQKKIENQTVCRTIIAIVLLAGASLISTLGMDGILTTVNNINATCSMIIWFIPFLILGPISIHKLCTRNSKNEPGVESVSSF